MIYWENLIWLLNFSEIGLEKIKIKNYFLDVKKSEYKNTGTYTFQVRKTIFSLKNIFISGLYKK
jgi:hypothetical protein